MRRWEYLLSTVAVFERKGLDSCQQFLADRGNEGWELVSMTVTPVQGNDHLEKFDNFILFFKRPKA
jgi:hypothetical protein